MRRERIGISITAPIKGGASLYDIYYNPSTGKCYRCTSISPMTWAEFEAPAITKANVEAVLTGTITSHSHASGSGDMTKAVYDSNDDGKIANSELTSGSDIADAISKKHSNTLDHSNSLDHTQGTDQGLDNGGANAVTALQAKTGYSHSQAAHAPSNAQANADITKAEIEAKLTGEISSHTHAGGSGEAEITVIKVGDTGNSTTTYADATGLSFTALANKEYIIEGWIRWATSATTVGIKLSCNGPSTPSFVSSVYNAALVTSGMSGGGGNNYNTGAATASAQATTDNLAMLNILFRNGSSQGTFIIRFAAETTGTVTVKDGSLIRYRQVN